MRKSGILGACLLLGLAACDDAPKKDLLDKAPVEVIYNTALDSMIKEHNFKKAAGQFDDVSRQHPFSPWASKAEIMAAYAFYEASEYENAIVNLEDFLTLHPSHAYAPYANYLLGMCFFVQMSGVARDQSLTYKALETFKALVKKYPGSSYAADGKFKMDLCLEHLAGHDMEVGRFYQANSLPLGALDRFTHVVQTYQTTSHVPEALHRMIEAMLTLGMTNQAQATAAVLGYNYPGNKWYGYTYALMEKHGALPKGAIVPSKIATTPAKPMAPEADVSAKNLPF